MMEQEHLSDDGTIVIIGTMEPGTEPSDELLGLQLIEEGE